MCDGSRGYGYQDIATGVGGVDGNDVGCLERCVWLYDVTCVDEGGGNGCGDEGVSRRQIGIL